MVGKVALVCGGRDFADLGAVWSQLDALHGLSGVRLLIQGGATGADDLASSWAQFNGVPQRKFPADWKAHGRAAGPLRNQQMLTEGKPDLVIAFPGGKGTADMVRRARAAGVEVLEVS
jgi:aspartokinase-like uncharacterized kinase